MYNTGNLEEEEVMDQFRERVSDLNQSDATLIRFLRARNHNLNAAEAMIRHAIEWRIQNDVDNWDKWTIDPLVVEKFPIVFSGGDYAGNPVVYMPLGEYPSRPMVEAGYLDEMIRQIIWSMERITVEREKTTGKFTLIIDLDGISVWTLMNSQARFSVVEIFRIFEKGYPETLSEALLINIPFVFEFGWKFIKPVLTGNTLDKVKMLGNTDKKYMPALLERMPVSSMVPKLQKLAMP